MEYPDFTAEYKSLMAKNLTREVFERLKNVVTDNGFSLEDAVNSGLQNPDSGIGVYAGDEQSYTCFAPLFDPIIQQYHGLSDNKLHETDLNPVMVNDCDPDPDSQYIISTRIRVGRNLEGMPLGPAISKAQRDQVEARIVTALGLLSGPLAGCYHSLTGMSATVQSQLINDHFLFKAGDRFFQSAGLNRDWPAGRGIYHNAEKTFLVWVNEEDQLRIISMQAGGHIRQVFERLTQALTALEQSLTFAFNSRLGYISSCPTNLGTAMRASVHIKLPCLAQDMTQFKAIVDQHHLQIRGIHGEHSDGEGGTYDISNRRRLGVTEVQCVQDLYTGVVALIAAEEKADKRKS